MSWHRAATPLGFEVGSDQFGLFVRPPRDFKPGDLLQSRRGPALPLFGKTSSGHEVTLLLIQLRATQGETPLELCRLLHVDFGTFRFWKSQTEDFTATDERLGSVPAVQAIDGEKRIVVRVAEQSAGTAFAAVMILSYGTLDQGLLDLFELVCQSVRFSI
ncbi:MAG: hypothetical protein AABZ47_09955 [Planctomycetota bacterium]